MNDKSVDLRELGQIIINHKIIIGIIMLIFVIIAGIYLAVIPRTYQSVSVLKIRQEKGLNDQALQSIGLENSIQAKDQMNTDAEILKSHSVVLPVIKVLEKSDKQGNYQDYDSYVKNHIVIEPVKNTEILKVAVTDKTPERAKQANQLLVESFLNRLTELSHDDARLTREFLEKRVITARQELTKNENKLQVYQVSNKMYSPDDQIKSLTEKLLTIDKVKADNQLDLETAKAALDTINKQLNNGGQGIADSPAIEEYKVQLSKLEMQKAGYINKYTAEHPKMKEMDNKINEVKKGLNKEINNVILQTAPSSNAVQQKLLADKYKNEAIIAVAKSKNKALAIIDMQDNAAIEALPKKEQGFIRAKRDVEVSQEIYVMLAKRLEEIKITEVMVPNEVQVIDEATLLNEPIRPRVILTLLSAILLGLVVGTTIVVFYSVIYCKIYTVDDIEKVVNIPVLGTIYDADTIYKKNVNRLGILEQVRKKLTVLWRKLWKI